MNQFHWVLWSSRSASRMRKTRRRNQVNNARCSIAMAEVIPCPPGSLPHWWDSSPLGLLQMTVEISLTMLYLSAALKTNHFLRLENTTLLSYPTKCTTFHPRTWIRSRNPQTFFLFHNLDASSCSGPPFPC